MKGCVRGPFESALIWVVDPFRAASGIEDFILVSLVTNAFGGPVFRKTFAFGSVLLLDNWEVHIGNLGTKGWWYGVRPFQARNG